MKSPYKLLQNAIDDAILDRDSFSDAYSRTGPESDEALRLIGKLTALKERRIKSLSPDEIEVVRCAFIYAEQWRRGVAAAQCDKREIAFSKNRADEYLKFRLSLWGKTKLDVVLGVQ